MEKITTNPKISTSIFDQRKFSSFLLFVLFFLILPTLVVPHDQILHTPLLHLLLHPNLKAKGNLLSDICNYFSFPYLLVDASLIVHGGIIEEGARRRQRRSGWYRHIETDTDTLHHRPYTFQGIYSTATSSNRIFTNNRSLIWPSSLSSTSSKDTMYNTNMESKNVESCRTNINTNEKKETSVPISDAGGTSTSIESKPTLSFHSPFLEDFPPPSPSTKTALVILNSSIQSPPSPIFNTLWNMSNFKVCADGGANRLFDATATSMETNDANDDNVYKPDLIKGDLDSLRPNVRSYYQRNCKTKIVCDSDQNFNDLDKALQSVQEWMKQNNGKDEEDEGPSSSISTTTTTMVYVYGAFGGRFDQEMASIQALYKWGEPFYHRIALYNDETCAFLIPGGVVYKIVLPFCPDFDGHNEKEEEMMLKNYNEFPAEGPTCGLIPLGCTCDFIKTSGLKWNLDGSAESKMEFGGMVSSSNRVVEEVVTVESSHPIVFTAEMRNPSIAP